MEQESGKPLRRKGAHLVPVPQDDHDRQLLHDVHAFGCHVVAVTRSASDDPERPLYAFSVGLHYNFGVPEIVVFGQKFGLMAAMINNFMGRTRAGERFEVDRPYRDFIEGHPICFTPVDLAHYAGYLGYAGWFYRDWSFPCWQMVWPSTDGVWPWCEGAPDLVRELQPILGPIPRLRE